MSTKKMTEEDRRAVAASVGIPEDLRQKLDALPNKVKLALVASLNGKTGAIIANVYNVNGSMQPRFTGKATLSSDGMLFCNFVDRDGNYHLGAFVGSYSDYKRNVESLATHVGMTGEEREEFMRNCFAWIGLAYTTAEMPK